MATNRNLSIWKLAQYLKGTKLTRSKSLYFVQVLDCRRTSHNDLNLKKMVLLWRHNHNLKRVDSVSYNSPCISSS